MRAKLKSLVALLVTVIVSGCSDPWNEKSVSHGVDKGTRFEVLDDSFLYCYLGDQFSLLPPDHFKFTPEEFRADPSIGVIDRDQKIGVTGVIPSGSEIEFIRIARKSDWNTGSYFVQYARFVDDTIFDKEVSIGNMLDGDYSVDQFSAHLKRIK